MSYCLLQGGKMNFRDILKTFKPFPKRDFRNSQSLKKVGEFTVVSADGRKYDLRNKLNNLSGSEWVFFLNSVEITNYPVKGRESYLHELRKQHPSPKPPQLMKKIIEFFSKEGDWILDPFMGVGGTLIGASLARRNAVGLDINLKYIEIYNKVCKKLDIKKQIALNEDARNIPNIFQDFEGFFDLILTDPPYANMMTKSRTGEKAKKRGRFSTPFTDSLNDIGNLPYFEYLDEIKNIIQRALPFLKPRGFLIMFAKDLQPTKEYHNMLHADLVLKLTEIKELRFRGYKIWYDKTQKLYPFGYPFTYVSNQLHQFILVFQKE
jgi:DNA modification methylase